MNSHEELLQRLFQCLNAHDHEGVAACYQEQATFRDIAFTLKGRKQIHAMWAMICLPDDKGTPSDIVATVEELTADGSGGRAVVVDDYTFRSTKKRVHNRVRSTFEFRDGLILRQIDQCSAVDWARQAFGNAFGTFLGIAGPVRRMLTMSKLKKAQPQAFE
jgi:ketosteroid isomerase-like protein